VSAFAVTGVFVREHLRSRLILVLLVVIPAVFVISAASVLGEFARALGGAVGGNSAVALGAGWAAAFLGGALGFFEVSSSRGADRRLALAGLHAGRVAFARITASVVLGVVVSTAAYVTLAVRSGIAHPAHAAVAVLSFALIYIAIGALVGSVLSDPLEGSLTVAFIFLLDAFTGPAMTGSSTLGDLTPTRKAADLLIAAGAGQGSSAGDWLAVAAMAAVALSLAFGMFWLSARARS
jgi:hypothetical protein